MKHTCDGIGINELGPCPACTGRPQAPALTRDETTEYLRAARDMETGIHGGFAAGLAAAYFAADPRNRIRLIVAFSAEFEHAVEALEDAR